MLAWARRSGRTRRARWSRRPSLPECRLVAIAGPHAGRHNVRERALLGASLDEDVGVRVGADLSERRRPRPWLGAGPSSSCWRS